MMQAEKMRETMEVAHDKELEMIDAAAEGAKVKSEEMHAAKMRAFDKAIQAIRDATKAAGEKKVVVSSAVADKATDVSSAVADKATDVSSAVADKATDVSSAVTKKARKIKIGAKKKAQTMPWLAPMAGVVLLLALAFSVSKKMRAPDSFDI
jgi:hypothetical protein